MHAQLLNSQCATVICHHTYLNCNHPWSLLGHNLWDDHSENNKQFQVTKIAVSIVHYFTYQYLAYEYCFLCLEASIVSFHFVTHTNPLFALIKDCIDVHLLPITYGFYHSYHSYKQTDSIQMPQLFAVANTEVRDFYYH